MVLALTSDTATQPQHVRRRPIRSWRRRSPRFPASGSVNIGGSSRPAVRAEVNPLLLSKLGVGLDQVRNALNAANANVPKGAARRRAAQPHASTTTTSSFTPANTLR